jgi:hypothetical protein
MNSHYVYFRVQYIEAGKETAIPGSGWYMKAKIFFSSPQFSPGKVFIFEFFRE